MSTKRDYIRAGDGRIMSPVEPHVLLPHVRKAVDDRDRPTSRNTRCLCGSGKRFKRCCMYAAKIAVTVMVLCMAGCATMIMRGIDPAHDASEGFFDVWHKDK